MKVLVVLCAVVASCLANTSIGYSYSAISPLTTYSSIAAPFSYAYNAPIIAAAPYAAPFPVPLATSVVPVAPAAVKTQYHAQDELGQAKYGHSEPFQAHDAVQDAHGNKIGSFSYVDPHGAIHRTDYVADGMGYRVAANDLPVAPAGTGPIVPLETPEVIAAKSHHAAAHLEALHRGRRSAYYGPYSAPVVTPSGHLADTPEVAAAKAAHYAEHARQSGHGASPYASQYSRHYAGLYGGPVVTPTGHLADTPEVAAAKAAHYAEHARQSGQAAAGPYASQYSGQYSGNYAGSYATPVVTPSGHLADTPEVAAAKAAHYAEHARQSGHGASPYAAPYAGSYSGSYSAYTHANGPWAVPVVTPTGHLADTPEVAAARDAHLAEHARRGKRSLFYQTPAATVPLPAPVVYHSPVAYAAPAPLAHVAPISPVFGVPAIKTEIVHNPGHAASYRID